MSKLLHNLRRLFQRQPDAGGTVLDGQGPNVQPGGNATLVVEEDAIESFMRLVERTTEGEYCCEETFDLLDEYVELVANDQDVEALMPLVKKHVDHCPDCGPRYEILLDILQNT
ncbi:MAG: hypothetical protein GWP61_08615 [Chloroflexi bacterium]|jgi:hypothetical protein|nr:hypothetical protein [Chloroflexota bacterium]